MQLTCTVHIPPAHLNVGYSLVLGIYKCKTQRCNASSLELNVARIDSVTQDIRNKHKTINTVHVRTRKFTFGDQFDHQRHNTYFIHLVMANTNIENNCK